MTTTTPGTTSPALLTDEMLARFDERAPMYDRENRFFDEDFAELKASGYLTSVVPKSFGGGGLGIDEFAKLQRRLAYVAPATAVAVNMHIYWTGVAADLNRMGDHGCDWMLERSAAGDIFAAGHGEAGNDLPLFLSSSSATKVDGGWEVNGHKIFGTLSPVWTWLGLHAMDTSDPDNPKIVHGFMHRDAPGYQIVETWDTLGMRATQSHDTVLDRAYIADDRTPVVCATGMAGAGPFHLSIFAWALVGFGAIYGGIAQRALDDTVGRMHERTSIALTRSMAYHPGVQHRVAEMRMAMDTIDWSVDRVAADWGAGVEHADWPIRIVSMKYTATNNAFKIVDTALDLTGGSGIFKRSRLEQMFRDCRLGRIHPANDLLSHELIGKLQLGINPDEAPRWG